MEHTDAQRAQWLHRRALSLWQQAFLTPGLASTLQLQNLRWALAAERAAIRLAPPHPDGLALEALLLRTMSSLAPDPWLRRAFLLESADALRRRLAACYVTPGGGAEGG